MSDASRIPVRVALLALSLAACARPTPSEVRAEAVIIIPRPELPQGLTAVLSLKQITYLPEGATPTATPVRPDVGPSQARFERVYADPIDEHVMVNPGIDVLGYGVGGTLLDYDGDGRVDVFLAQEDPDRGTPVCLYHNVSEPGVIVFEPDPIVCGRVWGPATGGGAVDLDGDGADELFILGTNRLTLVRFAPELQLVDLLDAWATPPPCNASAVLGTDLDQDGRLDVVVGCRLGRTAGSTEVRENLVLRQREDGRLVPFDGAFPMLEGLDNTLALGAVDYDDNGLLDLLLINDTFSRPGRRNTFNPSGGLMRRCPPYALCSFVQVQFATDSSAWGSFMGAGIVHVDGSGDHLVLSDWGPTRVIDIHDPQFADHAETFGFEPWEDGPQWTFSWGVVVDDFDGDGRDDVFMSQGMVSSSASERFFDHYDVLHEQLGAGFVVRTSDVGLDGPRFEDSRSALRPYSSRASVKADFDLDGGLEILTVGLEGVPVLRTEVGKHPDRCTLDPRPRYVPGHGVGYAVALDGAEFRHRDVQGQTQLGASRLIVTSGRNGVLRFPSGAEVPFDCGDSPGVLRVDEPEWIRWEASEEAIVVTLDGAWIPTGPSVLAVAVRSADASRFASAEYLDARTWRVALSDGDTDVMLRVAGRWVALWLPV